MISSFKRPLQALLIATPVWTLLAYAGAGPDGDTAAMIGAAMSPVSGNPSAAFMQIVARHNRTDKNFKNHQSCREVFTGNKGSVDPVSEQYMAAMGMNFLRQACRCEESPIREHLLRGVPESSTVDALSQKRFHLNAKTPQSEKEILVNTYALMYTLGQRESSGNFNEGRDLSPSAILKFPSRRQWESGAFQVSADSLPLDNFKGNPNLSASLNGRGPPVTKQVFANYLQTLAALPSQTDRALSCDLGIMAGTRESKSDVSGRTLHKLFEPRASCSKVVAHIKTNGGTVNPAMIDSTQSDVVACFRDLHKNCPAFSIEYTAVTARINRMAWGPLRVNGTETKHKKPYIIPACAGYFNELYESKNQFCALTAARQEIPNFVADPSELPVPESMPDDTSEIYGPPAPSDGVYGPPAPDSGVYGPPEAPKLPESAVAPTSTSANDEY